MIVHNYWCNRCVKPYAFSEKEEEEVVVCPTCYNKMEYICSEDINEETRLVTKKWRDEKRQKSHPENKSFNSSAPTITCPYCQSTDCNKISSTSKAINIALFGIFGNKRRYQWHCNKCKSDF